MKKIICIALGVFLVLAGIFFIPKLVHTCDDCGAFFIGAGYEPSILEDIYSSKELTICKKCAEEQHALSIAIGMDVDEYKKNIFD